MKRAILFFLFVTLAGAQNGRKPAVAGTFYPAKANELAAMIDSFLAKGSGSSASEPLFALIAPHAGYPYSGPVAAYGYAQLRGRKFDRVVVIAPSHVEPFRFASVFDGDAYETPLGSIPVDKAFCAKLASGKGPIRLSKAGHEIEGSRGEHALEVQLPFLQRTLGQFRLVPIVLGDQSYDTCRALGVALAKLAAGSNTLIVASSDLSHFHPSDTAVTIDRKTLRAITEWDYLSMSQNFATEVWEACGGGPIVAAMIASERLGANEARLLKYANSGDTTGDRSSVVGYGAVALMKSPQSASAAPQFALTAEEQADLIVLAKKSVETAVRERKLIDYTPKGAFAQERGAFVTLKERGMLRGCIGYISPSKPLGVTVRDVAAAAALEDRRFRPVATSELAELRYEISVLSPMRRVYDVKQIQVGKHGLVIRKGSYTGLLLPQVPVEEKWDRMTFLREVCVKAGLPPEAWQDPETDLFTFTALVFGEK